MTGLTDPKQKIIGFDAGGVDYITKPFQIEEVLPRGCRSTSSAATCIARPTSSPTSSR
jgi:DNA-binding response OmpR family regulator